MIDGLVLQEVISLATGNSDQLVEKRAAPESGGPRRSGQHQYAGQGEDLRGKGPLRYQKTVSVSPSVGDGHGMGFATLLKQLFRKKA